MAALPACRIGDISTGHDCWPSRPNDEGSGSFFIDGLGAHRVGDHWITHCCTDPDGGCHDGVLSFGSQTFFVDGQAIGRVTDPISCGDFVATGSSTFIIN